MRPPITVAVALRHTRNRVGSIAASFSSKQWCLDNCVWQRGWWEASSTRNRSLPVFSTSISSQCCNRVSSVILLVTVAMLRHARHLKVRLWAVCDRPLNFRAVIDLLQPVIPARAGARWNRRTSEHPRAFPWEAAIGPSAATVTNSIVR
jgi:hypothetical protein